MSRLPRASDSRSWRVRTVVAHSRRVALLLGYAAETAGGMRVLHTSCVEPETEIGYAASHRLLWPVLGYADEIPQPQARALRVVFGQAEGPAPDRFLVALAVLTLLAEVAVEQPMLCLVDDAHWADRATLDGLAFVARRIDGEPIAVMLATRADEGRRDPLVGMVDLPLAGSGTTPRPSTAAA